MIKFESTEVVGWEHAIRGMRNPMNSWEKSDSGWRHYSNLTHTNMGLVDYQQSIHDELELGPNDHDLMMRLAAGGPVHAKYRRMIIVYVDITAPLYWWKEFDTYKIGTVANSCSTMHKIAAKEFTREDFSHEHLSSEETGYNTTGANVSFSPDKWLDLTIEILNYYRKCFIEDGKSKKDWWQMIQLLPSSYNQKRTVMMNYEVLAGIYPMRKDHKLDEWHVFCDWIEQLPYSEIIIGERGVSVCLDQGRKA